MADLSKHLATLLKESRKNANMTAKEASEKLSKLGIKLSGVTISGYENGRSKPDAEKFLALCSIYGIDNPIPLLLEILSRDDELTPSLNEKLVIRNSFMELLHSAEHNLDYPEIGFMRSDERKLLTNYRKLNNFNKETVNLLVERMIEGCQTVINLIQKPMYNLAVSAGKGQFLDSDDFEMKEFPEEVVPKDSTFAVRVSGDSMEPKFKDKSIVFVKRAKTLEPGDVGIFVLNDEGYIKELGVNNNLISYNPKYKDIVIKEFDDLRIIGKVIGEPYLEE